MITQFPLLASVTVVTAGTPVQYAPDATSNTPGAPGIGVVQLRYRRVEIRPLASNSGNILVGFLQRGVIQRPIVLAANAYPLVLEASTENCPINLNDLWFDASAANQTVMIIAVPFRK
jgi:hypothetical protein